MPNNFEQDASYIIMVSKNSRYHLRHLYSVSQANHVAKYYTVIFGVSRGSYISLFAYI
jgi:hypothetical protein